MADIFTDSAALTLAGEPWLKTLQNLLNLFQASLATSKFFDQPKIQAKS